MTLPRPDDASPTVLSCYARLGVTREETLLLPQITPQLRAISKTLRRAGQPKTIRQRTITHEANSAERKAASERISDIHALAYSAGTDLLTSWPHYLAAVDDDDIRRLLAKRREHAHAVARLLPIEAFCLAAGVSPLRVLELLVAAVVRQGAQASTIIAAVTHPSVVQKTVEMALTDEGIDDRNTLHKAVSFLPTPKGNTTIINNTPIAHASSAANAASQAESAMIGAPPPESTIRRLSDRFNEARLLPTAAQPVTSAVAEVEGKSRDAAGNAPDATDEPPALPEAPAPPLARFGFAPPRHAVPSRRAEESPASVARPREIVTEDDVDPLEEEEDE